MWAGPGPRAALHGLSRPAAQACQEGFSAPCPLRPPGLHSYPIKAQGRPSRPLTDTHPANPLPPGF